MKIILSMCEQTNTPYPRKPCYENLIKTFSSHELYVLGDNLSDSMCSFVLSHNPTFFENKKRGRPQWMIDKIDFCVDNFEDSDQLYLVEDDYLHLEQSDILLQEGIQHSDYVTLYDHPDKYGQHPNKNPEVVGLGESSIVFRTNHSHWKYTNSTTGTFSCTRKTLREDRDVWIRQIKSSGWWDYLSFVELRSKPRLIVTCIPGRSTHLHSPNMYSPFFNVPINI